MANETEVIRERMEATRTDLSDKLEKLEQQVTDTVQGATSAVAETVQNAASTVNEAVQSAREVVEAVKESVEGAAESVKGTVDAVKDVAENAAEGVRETFHGAAESVRQGLADAAGVVRNTFDLPAHVDRHPWLMIGGAVAVGFVAGKLLDYAPHITDAAAGAAETGGRFARSAVSAAGAAASATGSLMSTLEHTFGPEFNQVKALALGALLGLVRDMAVKAAPDTMSRQVGEIFDSFTSKLGGKPVEGPVVGPRPSEQEVHNGPERRF